MFKGEESTRRFAPIVELILIVALAEAAYLIARAIGLIDVLANWFAQHNTQTIEELILVIVSFSVGVGVLCIRQWHQ
ncbi:MAG TPA: hypothetical protein VGI75_08655, partial [Pirellulales bacterium]